MSVALERAELRAKIAMAIDAYGKPVKTADMMLNPAIFALGDITRFQLGQHLRHMVARKMIRATRDGGFAPLKSRSIETTAGGDVASEFGLDGAVVIVIKDREILIKTAKAKFAISTE